METRHGLKLATWPHEGGVVMQNGDVRGDNITACNEGMTNWPTYRFADDETSPRLTLSPE